MSRIALIRNGVVENVIEADMEFALTLGYDAAIETDIAGPGWQYVAGGLIPPESAHVVEPEPVKSLYMTNHAFDMRYTLPERIAIERLALQKDEDGDFTDTALAVQVSLERAKKAKYTDPNYEPTRKGVMMFVLAGVLTEERALEILDTPIRPDEEWRAQ